MSFDDYIFIHPSFFGGVARAIDATGALGKQAFLISPTPAAADARALASDFRRTNRDLHEALANLKENASK